MMVPLLMVTHVYVLKRLWRREARSPAALA